MPFFVIFTLVFSGLLLLLIGVIAWNVLIKKKLPDSTYTPFDYITAQTSAEFHEEKEEKAEEEQEKGKGASKPTLP